MYHIVCVTKYRRLVITEEVDSVLQSVYIEISKRYEIRFLETGDEADHVHFLVPSVPTYSLTMIAAKIKSITAREIFAKVPSLKKEL